MPIRACIFDLFGTIVPISRLDDYDNRLKIVARATGVDEAAFLREWVATHAARNVGTLPTLEANVREVCRRLGRVPDPDLVHGSLAAFRELVQATLTPKPESEEVLREIVRRGLPLGLVSSCNPEVPHRFRAGPLARYFRELIFSCEVGMMKPDPAIYLAMTRRLGVEPAGCLYIGDGHARELAGASAVGMTTVLVDYDATGGFIWDRDESADHRVRDLREILSILATRAGTPGV
jgi:putative hydrolase of the HAD superfamily